MKRYIFIIGLWAACCALPNTLQAQWGFTVTQGQRGNCVGCGDIEITVINFGSIPVNGFSTRQECEVARQSISGISQSFVCGCTLYIICSACTGRDIAGIGVGADGSVNTNGGSVRLNGTSQGSSYYTPNPFDEIQDAYDQKNYQNEMLFGEVAQNENTAQYLLTDDKDFNGYIANVLPKGDIDWGNVKPVISTVPSLSDDINNRPHGTKTLDNYKITKRLYGEGVGEEIIGYDYDAYSREVVEPKLSELMHPNAEEATKGPELFSTDDLANALLGGAQDHIFNKVKDFANEAPDLIISAGAGSWGLAQRLIDFKNTVTNIVPNFAKETFRNTLDVFNGKLTPEQMYGRQNKMGFNALRKIAQ
jgi:hypothetical protein